MGPWEGRRDGRKKASLASARLTCPRAARTPHKTQGPVPNASVSCCASLGGSEPQQEGPQVWSHNPISRNVVPHSLSRGRSAVSWPLQGCGGVGAQVVTCELLMETFLCPEFGLLRTSFYLKALMPGNSGQTARPSRRSETRVPVAPAG